MKRTEQSAGQAREYNRALTPDHQEQFYLAGMNAIAERFWQLARNKGSDPQEIRTYADLLHDHFEQKIKVEKNSIALRHLTLLEAKSKALQELAKDTTLTDTQYAGRIRAIFGYEKPVTNGNGHQNGKPQRFLENGLAS